MTDTKYWWQSRTIWLQIVAALFAILSVFHILPTGIDQEQLVGAIMGLVAVATLILRFRSTHVIATDTLPPGAGASARIAAIGLALGLAACATPTGAPSSMQRLALISERFDQAQAFAAPFLDFLPPDRARLVRIAAELVRQALATARSASSLAVREDALRTAEQATAEYQFVTGG
ncbi:hypothetical protein [Sphingomonas sp. 2378]|uniref:hypothetical protein n=1 Tax=Sphingomonas sp. 2378 TaxID=1219748 RepID=UPI00311B0408